MRNFRVTVDGVGYDVTVEEVAGFNAKPVQYSAPQPVAAPVAAPQAAAPVQAQAPAVVAAPAAPAAPADVTGGVEITAPMPGMLVKFTAAEGSDVKAGQVVLVLEAMKMENDISAPCDGKLYYVATPGGNVSTGDKLAVIK